MQEKRLKSIEALEKLLRDYQFQTVLDVGCGTGRHLKRFRQAGKQAVGIDYVGLCEGVIVADYLAHEFAEPFDCLWLSHVLEHQVNVNLFLKKVYRDLKEGGILVVTVPPLKHPIVGGHVTLWNAGLLLYNLVLAGFDCSQARIKQYGYNISLITPKIPAAIPQAKLRFGDGDLELLRDFFPSHPRLVWGQGTRGDLQQLRWDGDELVFCTPLVPSPSARLLRFFRPAYWAQKWAERAA
jgi:SAM-dependent methyltransferase